MAKRLGITTLEGQLEIDHDRGVIYFHMTDPEEIEGNYSVTFLRISGLPVPIPKRSIDMSFKGIPDANRRDLVDY